MKDLLIIALNCKDELEFKGCDFYNDTNYPNDLNFFVKLNRIGIDIRESEIKNGNPYKMICFVDYLKYNISKFSKNWLYEFSINNPPSPKDLYSNKVNVGLNMRESNLSYSFVISDSITFNFISNFYRFEKELNEPNNLNSRNSIFYTYCVHQKLRLLNYKFDDSMKIKLI